MDRHIVCFTVPSLEISLARLADPVLRHRPVGIASLNHPKARLYEVSSEARQEGVRTGMPIHHATTLCPDLRVLPSYPARLVSAQQALFAMMDRYAPVWEPVQAGSFFLDLTGTIRLYGSACDTASRLQHEVSRHYRLEGVLGLGSNKLIAHTAAALIQPAQLYEVRHGSEQDFMASLLLEAFPLLNRPHMKTVMERLNDLNLRTFGDVTDVPWPALEAVLGKWAAPLVRWSQGIDPSPVLPPPARSIVERSQPIRPSEIDEPSIRNILLTLLEQLCRTLRRQRRACHGVTLALAYSDRTEVVRHERIERGSYWEHELAPVVSTLLQRCFRRRIRVRSVRLAATHLLPPTEQCTLFESSEKSAEHLRRQRLSLAMDRLKERHGDHIICYGRALPTTPPRTDQSQPLSDT